MHILKVYSEHNNSNYMFISFILLMFFIYNFVSQEIEFSSIVGG